MIPIVTIDFETRSYANLKKVGAWAYSEHPTTELICVCWGIDDQPIQSWVPGQPPPADLFEYIDDGFIMEAHNVAFERSIWTNVLHKRLGWRLPSVEQWRDTMAAAAYYSLPLSLDKLATALGYQGKDPRGARLISTYSCLYNKNAKAEIPASVLDEWIAYCKRDVQIEQSISDYLGDLPDHELWFWLLDQATNMRGLHLDQEGIDHATAVVKKRSKILNAEYKAITGLDATQVAKSLEWFQAKGVPLETMQADELEDVLEELPQGDVRRALEIRLRTNKASTKKLDAMSRQRGMDGRARFQTRYHGANTGRTTGTGLQPLNLNRGMEGVKPEELVTNISFESPEWLDVMYEDALDAVAKASRHWIKAADGSEIMAGDFMSVEAVVLACLSGEEWKKQAFASDAKIYEMMADKIYKLPPGTVTKQTHPMERQDGKIGELAFGYQGALSAWLKFDSSGRHSDERILEINRGWRAEHPMTTLFWRKLQWEAIDCVTYKRPTSYRQIGFEIVDEWLTMILPDGKRLWYYKPEVRYHWPHWHKPLEKEDCGDGTCDCVKVPTLTYMSQKAGQWKRVSTYGGKLTENAVQATSRQILKAAMGRVRDAWDGPLKAIGYLKEGESSIILSVYDEIVCEVPKGWSNKEQFEELMRGPLPDWCADWPINVDAWIGDRYKK